MNKLLKGLKLSKPIGSIVQPFEFELATISNLEKWFDLDAVSRLKNFVELAKSLEKDNKNAASVGDSRTELLRIEELATALSIMLSQAPATVEGELALVGHKAFGDLQKINRLSSDLAMLATEVQDRLETFPVQGRRQSHSFLVSGIAEEAKRVGVDISDSEHSQFTAICKCIFEAAGIPFDPRGSIRAFIKTQA